MAIQPPTDFQQQGAQPGAQQPASMPGQQPGMGSQAPMPEQGSFPPADPQSQKMGTVAIENMLDNIYGEGWEPLIGELSSASPEQLPETVGRITAQMYSIQEEFAKAAGKQMPQEIALDVGSQMIEELFTIMESQGIYQAESPEEEQQLMGEALLYATDFYKQHLQEKGEFDEQSASQLGQDLMSGAYDEGGADIRQPRLPEVETPPLQNARDPGMLKRAQKAYGG